MQIREKIIETLLLNWIELNQVQACRRYQFATAAISYLNAKNLNWFSWSSGSETNGWVSRFTVVGKEYLQPLLPLECNVIMRRAHSLMCRLFCFIDFQFIQKVDLHKMCLHTQQTHFNQAISNIKITAHQLWLDWVERCYWNLIKVEKKLAPLHWGLKFWKKTTKS